MRAPTRRPFSAQAWFSNWPIEQLTTLAAVTLGCLVFLPYLGAVGLWDPWETHYGEVAREMVERNDFIHPHWEKDWFFSKPALTMWMQAVGMLAGSRGPAVPLLLALALLGVGAMFIRRRAPVIQFWSTLSLLAGLIALALGLWASRLALPWKFGDLVNDDGALPVLFEWGVRMPFALFSITALGFLTWALTRIVNARVALAAAFALSTMPLYFLLSRQAVTDPPLISATMCGMSCALVALFDAGTEHRKGWWYGAWFFFALATLAKGWLGFLVPTAVFGAYVVLFVASTSDVIASAKWVKRELGWPLTWGLVAGLVAGAIAARIGQAQQTVFISAADLGRRDSWSTAPNWLALTWGLLSMWVVTTFLARRRAGAPGQERLTPRLIALFRDMQLGPGVLLFLAVSLPWYFEMFTFRALDDEGRRFWVRFIVHDHLSRFFSGVFTTTPGGTFAYFIEQGGYAIFPWVLAVPGAMGVVSRLRIRGAGLTSTDAVGAIALLWLIITWFAVGDSATKFHHYVFPMLPPMAILIGLFVDQLWHEGLESHMVALVAGVPLFVLVGHDLWTAPKSFTDLFVFNYERPYPEFLVTRPALGPWSIKQCMHFGFMAGLASLAVAAFLKAKRALFALAAAGTLFFALWFSWSHWVDLSAHWTQRDQFWRYYTRRQPGEPIAAFMMNWRGETLYSRNRVEQFRSGNAVAELQSYANRPGRKWALVEHGRLSVVTNALSRHRVTLVDRDLNDKFVLLTIE